MKKILCGITFIITSLVLAFATPVFPNPSSNEYILILPYSPEEDERLNSLREEFVKKITKIVDYPTTTTVLPWAQAHEEIRTKSDRTYFP